MKKVVLKICSIVLLMITFVSLCLMGGCASKGVILKLEEAYELGLISREELQQIADYNNRVEENPYTVDEIGKRTQKGIRKTYTQFLVGKVDFKVDIEYVHIKKFFGKYGNAFVVEMDLLNRGSFGEWYLEIDGIVFRFSGIRILYGIVVFIEK